MATHTHAPAPVLRRARRQLIEQGEHPGNLVHERLSSSWQRSLQAGLNPAGRLDVDAPLSGARLNQVLARHQELLAHSRPVMEYLYEQVRHSHSMVILADRQGVLMHTLGDPDFLGKAERVALTQGASWHEQHRGTNAIGTALADGGAIEIHGAEHFLERNAILTCAAAPILAANGTLAGILDISGDQRSRHPHTLGLVNTAARMIENRLLVAGYKRGIRLHLHAQPEGIGTVAEGIVALSTDGWIVGANRAGLGLLGLAPADLGATPIARVLSLRLEQLLDWGRRRADQVLPVHRHDGQPLFLQVVADRPSLTQAPANPAPANDALSQLDTGDARWQRAADKARRVADKPIPLLLRGESGVGKELFAKAVHQTGPRRAAPFVAINCAALPENLIEAELFGYAPGAFTGARKEGAIGRLREAHGGTLFLDEIGDMPLALQSRLLRVLQEREVTPLGGGKAVAVDFALICATHRDLPEEIEAGRFRSDLYYRINGLTLNLPALRERADFQALTARILDEFAPGRPLAIAPDLFARLAAYRWPGNLRQYASLLRTAVAMLDPDEATIDWFHLPDDLADLLQRDSAPARPEPAPGTAPTAPAGKLQELSRHAMRQALAACAGNVSQAARQLGVSRQTLYRHLKE